MKEHERQHESIAELRERLSEDPEFAGAWEATRAKSRIALALLRLRRSAKLTQVQLAEKTGWDKAHISRLESASGGVPDTATIARYVQACDAEVGFMFVKLDEERKPAIVLVPLSSDTALQSVVDLVGRQPSDAAPEAEQANDRFLEV